MHVSFIFAHVVEFCMNVLFSARQQGVLLCMYVAIYVYVCIVGFKEDMFTLIII